MSIALRGAILAASRRADGAVVFLDVDGDWNENMRAAAVARASDERRALADRATYETRRHLVVGPRLLEIVEVDGHVIPAGQGGHPRSAAPDTLADAFRHLCANRPAAHAGVLRGDRAANTFSLCAASDRPGLPRGGFDPAPPRGM